MTASGGEVGRLSIVGGAEVRRFCFGTTLFELRKTNYLYQAISCVRELSSSFGRPHHLCALVQNLILFFGTKNQLIYHQACHMFTK